MLAEELYELRAQHPDAAPLDQFFAATRKLTERTSAKLAAELHADLKAQGRFAHAARLLSAQGHKPSFLTFPPGPDLCFLHKLTDSEYLEAMRIRLLAPFCPDTGLDPFPCPCKTQDPIDLRAHPEHPLTCRLMGDLRNRRHSALNHLLCQLIRRAQPDSAIDMEPRDIAGPF